jgi:hydroxymethylpyrimidine pyrophosphatase-like HAD family hydrolase
MHPLDRRACTRIAQQAVRLQGDACVQVFTDSAIYEINPHQADDPQTVLERICVVKSPVNEVPDIFLKLLISQTPARLKKLFESLDTPQLRAEFSAFQSSGNYLEFVKAGVNKGSALSDVRARCGDARTILAIGDYENDLELIARADIGGAPANAIGAVKAAAKVVLPVDNNHSAVARFLETVL